MIQNIWAEFKVCFSLVVSVCFWQSSLSPCSPTWTQWCLQPRSPSCSSFIPRYCLVYTVMPPLRAQASIITVTDHVITVSYSCQVISDIVSSCRKLFVFYFILTSCKAEIMLFFVICNWFSPHLHLNMWFIGCVFLLDFTLLIFKAQCEICCVTVVDVLPLPPALHLLNCNCALLFSLKTNETNSNPHGQLCFFFFFFLTFEIQMKRRVCLTQNIKWMSCPDFAHWKL